MLSSLVVPALPTMQQRAAARPRPGSPGCSPATCSRPRSAPRSSAASATCTARSGCCCGRCCVLIVGTLLAAVASSLPLLIAARVIQGVAGGIFPLAFGIVRDEFPPEKVAGGIGLLSAILGVGGGVGIVLSGVIVEHLDYHWLFWIPLVAIVARRRRHLAPGPGIAGAHARPGQLAGRGADDDRHLGGAAGDQPDLELGLGLEQDPRPDPASASLFVVAWIAVEVRSETPLIDMTMMRVRGVWTTNAAAFLLGAGPLRVLRRLPAVRPAADQHRLRLRRLGRRLRPLPAAGDDRDDDPRPQGRRDLRPLRLAGGAARRHRVLDRLLPAAGGRPRATPASC